MNKIEMNIYDRARLNRELLGTDVDETDLKEKMIAIAYEKESLSMLVNRMRIQKNYLDISEMEYGEDYEVITGTHIFEGNPFLDEEEYKNYLKENCIEVKYGILVTMENSQQYIEEWYSDIYEAREDLEKYKSSIEDYDNIELCYLPSFNYVTDTECMFGTEQECIEYMEDLIDADECEEFISFDQLDFEYDEIYWNTAINFDEYDNKVNVDNAIKCGLGVLEVTNSGEQYLFLRGCGMDMSFQHLRYQALTFGAISDEYIYKLDWLKANVSEEEYDEVLKKLGVDLKRLRKAS